MKLYDKLIKKVENLQNEDYNTFKVAPPNAKFIGHKQELVLPSETAFELGARNNPSISFFLITEDEALVPQDEILLLGKDISEIKGDSPFARITLIRTEDIMSQGEQAAYHAIEGITLGKYDVAPKGYMLRASSLSQREQVRVSKKAVKSGLSFADVGAQFIEQYHSHEQVKAVKIVFITLDTFPYEQLQDIATEAHEITRALDKIISDLDFDCITCDWKVICDDTPGMRELHKGIGKV
ncbi:MAG: hypothetical protein R3Y24_07640 [Eubacteriales bacterium]